MAFSLPFPRTGDGFLEEELIAAAGAEEDHVELRAAQAEIVADVLLVLFMDVEPQQDLPVALQGELREKAADDPDLLPPQQGAELSGRAVLRLRARLDGRLAAAAESRAAIVVGG